MWSGLIAGEALMGLLVATAVFNHPPPAIFKRAPTSRAWWRAWAILGPVTDVPACRF